jgi:hypothetical protein
VVLRTARLRHLLLVRQEALLVALLLALALPVQ